MPRSIPTIFVALSLFLALAAPPATADSVLSTRRVDVERTIAIQGVRFVETGISTQHPRGSRFLVGPDAAGLFRDRDGQIATWVGPGESQWAFESIVKIGTRAQEMAQHRCWVFNGAGWELEGGGADNAPADVPPGIWLSQTLELSEAHPTVVIRVASGVTLTLPPSAGWQGHTVTVVLLDASGPSTLVGVEAGSYQLANQYDTVTVTAAGGWHVVSEYRVTAPPPVTGQSGKSPATALRPQRP